MEKKYKIEYKGKVLNTNYWEPISDEEYLQAKSDYYSLPNFDKVKKQLLKIINDNGTKVDLVTHYYFRKIMSKVKLYFNNWSIEDVFNCKQLVEYMSAKSKQNTKVYPTNWSLYRKMYKMFGLAGKGVASPPTQFSLKTVDYILSKYNVNGNWYDYSCGWGIRLLGAIRNKVNYYGTDPNYELVNQLNKLNNDINNITDINSITEIKCCGSEEFNPNWENKMGLCFSSPPYFDLEDYKIGNQSYTEGTTFEDWLNNYVKPTISNIKKYLISDGYFLVNIKDTKQYKLTEDWKRIAEEFGFTFIGTEVMDVHNRSFGTINGNGKNNQHCGDEQIYVFKK